MTYTRKISFEIGVDEGTNPPSARELTEALSQALPKEFWADYREDPWGVVSITPLNYDNTPVQWQSSEKTNWKERWQEQVDENQTLVKQIRDLEHQISKQQLTLGKKTRRIFTLERTIIDMIVNKEESE